MAAVHGISCQPRGGFEDQVTTEGSMGGFHQCWLEPSKSMIIFLVIFHVVYIMGLKSMKFNVVFHVVYIMVYIMGFFHGVFNLQKPSWLMIRWGMLLPTILGKKSSGGIPTMIEGLAVATAQMGVPKKMDGLFQGQSIYTWMRKIGATQKKIFGKLPLNMV